MALNLEAKKVVVKQVNALAKGSISVGVAEYRGRVTAHLNKHSRRNTCTYGL
jgi:ribosomal protein L10